VIYRSRNAINRTQKNTDDVFIKSPYARLQSYDTSYSRRVLRHVKIPLMTRLCSMIFEVCPTARDAISRVLKRGNLDENQRNSLVDGPCAHARTLIADFCPISRCDGVIKSLFNSRAKCVCVAYVHVPPPHTRMKHWITRAQ